MVPEAVTDLYHRAFGDEPAVIASAPGRVNLIGEHTDYNGGEVLPIAISRRTWVAMGNAGSLVSRAVSDTEEEAGEFKSPVRSRSGRWWDYVSGHTSFPGVTLPNADIAVTSDVPAGAGLSSSAALEVAAGIAYAALAGQSRSLRDVALDSWRLETQFVGVSCGIMDQFASALSRKGHALHIWCDTTDTEHVPFNESILIFDTAVPRSLRSSQFNTRQAECAEALEMLRKTNPGLENLAHASIDEIESANLPQNLADRAIHVVTETQRVQTAVQQLRDSGTISGDLLYASHASLRDRYKCSSRELDWFVDRAMQSPGIVGARLTGAGWGGCAIALGNPDALSDAGAAIAIEYQQAFNLEPRVWITEAENGAGIEKNSVA
jgi:galactokinase